MNDQTSSNTQEYIRFAPHPARLIAAFVDYLLLGILIPIIGAKIDNDFLRFFAALSFSAAYYGIGNSEVMNGQTLGKRLFGLRVISINSAKAISITHSISRYLLSFGAIMISAELPSIIYRKYGIASSAYLIEGNLAFALCYTFTAFFLFLLLKTRRSTHDILCKTAVIRASVGCSEEALLGLIEKIKLEIPKKLIAIVLGLSLGIFFFLSGFSNNDEVNKVRGAKYYLESKLEIKIQHIGLENNLLTLYISGHRDRESKKNESNEAIAKAIANQLQKRNLLESRKLTFYFLWTELGSQKEPEIFNLVLDNENT